MLVAELRRTKWGGWQVAHDFKLSYIQNGEGFQQSTVYWQATFLSQISGI